MTDTDKVLVVTAAEVDQRLGADEVAAVPGCEPVLAASAKEAIAVLSRLQPLLVLADLDLPGMPGDELCRVIRQDDALGTVPVVLMIGAADAETARRVFNAGADDFLLKPPLPPRVMAKVAAAREARRMPAQAVPEVETVTILVADDDHFFRTLLAQLLEGAGYHVVTAQNGLEALQLFHHGSPSPDLAVVDLMMPGLGGEELIRRIREFPLAAHLPVIAVSGVRRDARTREELRRLGVLEFVDKTMFNAERFVGSVNANLYVGANSRAEIRAPFYGLCDFRRPGDVGWLAGLVTTLARRGAFVRTMSPAPVDAVVDLRLDLGAGLPRVACKATVVWQRPFSRGRGLVVPGMGLRFADVGAEAEQRIEALIAAATDAG